VGAAEPQLREKMVDLYAKIADSYDVPSQAELENLAAIEKRFEEAKKDFAKLQKKMKSEELELMSFEEFVES
jgi:cell fate regulator YaaT (PSP1 superfamily)